MELSFRQLVRNISLIFALLIIFCFWGMFDAINWAVLYGAEAFPFPFFSFYLNVYASADVFISVGFISVVGLYVTATYRDRIAGRMRQHPPRKEPEEKDNNKE